MIYSFLKLFASRGSRRVRRRKHTSVSSYAKRTSPETLRGSRDALREDIAMDIVQNNPEDDLQEIFVNNSLKAEMVRCMTCVTLAIIITTCIQPDVMSPYLDSLIPTLTFFLGYFFPASSS